MFAYISWDYKQIVRKNLTSTEMSIKFCHKWSYVVDIIFDYMLLVVG